MHTCMGRPKTWEIEACCSWQAEPSVTATDDRTGAITEPIGSFSAAIGSDRAAEPPRKREACL